MTKFYIDENELWHIGNKIYPATTCNLVDNSPNIKIISVGNRDVLYVGSVTELAKGDGTPYLDVADLLSSTKDFLSLQ